MAQKDRATLSSDKNTTFADNVIGDITAEDLRDQQGDIIDSFLILNSSTEQTLNSDLNIVGELAISGKSAFANDVVIVNSAADFPTPVSDVITLADSTTYVIDGAIDIGNDTFILGLNTKIVGVDSQTSSITSTSAGTLFTATQNFILENFKVTFTSGTVFACTGAAFESAYITKFTINSCTSVGTFTTWYSLYFDKGAVVSGGSGLSFVGACNILIMELVEFIIWNNSGTAINLGTATFSTCSFYRCGFQGLGGTGQTAINIAASSANINSGKLGRINSCVFSTGLSSTVANYAVGNLRWSAVLNINLLSSERQAQGYIQASALNTTFSATGIGNEVLVNFGTAFLAETQNQFTISNAGRFTYNGIFPQRVFITATVFASVSGGASRQYLYSFAKNGTIITGSGSKNQYDGSTPGSCVVSSIVTLSAGDYIELKVQAITATTSLNVDTASIKAIGQ